MDFFSYVLYPFQAEKYHKKYSVFPSSELSVGVLGHKLYRSKIPDQEVRKILSKKSASPVFFTLALGKQDFEVQAVVEILKGYLKGKTHELFSFEIVAFEDYTLFYPVKQGHYLYSRDSELFFVSEITELAGRSYLHWSPLCLEYQKREKKFYGIKDHNGVYTYSSRMNNFVSPEEIEMRKLEMSSFINEKNSEGFVSIPWENGESEESEALLNLSHIWKIKKTVTPSFVSVYRERFSKNDKKIFNTNKLVISLEEKSKLTEKSALSLVAGDFSSWIEESLLRIRLGKSPVFRLYCEDSDLAKLSFSRLLERNPSLEDFVSDFQVIGNLVQVPVLEEENVFLFLNSINKNN